MNEDDLLIYAGVPWCVGPKRPEREPPIDLHTSVSANNPPTTDEVIDSEIARLLEEPMRPGEAVQAMFDRKEHEVRALAHSLSRAELAKLCSRLTEPSGTLGAALRRLTAERRQRLASFIRSLRERGGAL